MSDVKRWTALRKTSGHQGMVQDPRGQWVGLDDHEAALKAAADEVSKLRGLVGRLFASAPACPTCDKGTTTKKTCPYSRALAEAEEALR